MLTRMLKSFFELVQLSQASTRCVFLSKEIVQTERDIVCADRLRYDAAHKQSHYFRESFL